MRKTIIAAVSLSFIAACGTVADCSGEAPSGADSASPGADAGHSDSSVADQRVVDGTAPDNHASDGRTPDGRTPDGHNADAHVVDSGRPDSLASDLVAVDIRLTDAALDAGAIDAADSGACIEPTPTADRPAGTTCRLCRPIGTEPGGSGVCATHADCTAGINGRCSLGQIGEFCSYDECFIDAHCADGKVCSCDGAYFSGANTCVPANCRVNADCTSGRCSPSYGCLMGGSPEGWYCRTAADECATDSQCTDYAAGRCAYNSTLSHWACDYGVCIP